MNSTNYENREEATYTEHDGRAGRREAKALRPYRIHTEMTMITNAQRFCRWYRDSSCIWPLFYCRMCLICHAQTGGRCPCNADMNIGIPTPHLQNVVVTFHIGVDHVNLKHLASVIPWIEYDPRKFAAATMRLANPRSTCLLFGSGRGVCTGAKTRSEARLAAYSYVCLLKRLGIQCHFASFAVQNIVSAVHCNFRIDLISIAETESSYCGYEPEMFPGLMYRKKANGYTIVFLVFESGKCVITGGRSQEDILIHWEEFYQTVLVAHMIGMSPASNHVMDATTMQNISLVFGVEPKALLDTGTVADDWSQVMSNLCPEVKALVNLTGRGGNRKHPT